MSRQQLYINDKLMDMPQEAIKFKVESNLLSDADSIMTAHSYNIVLPRTMHNDEVFALAYVAGADTGGKITHRYLSCSLYVDGVPLFANGRCVLTSVDEKGYNCNLYWGLLGIFDKIKDEGLDLCDLPMSKYYPYPVNADGNWLKLTAHYTTGVYNSGMNNDIYQGLSTDGKAEADRYPWGLFVITANDILTLITDVYNLTLDISPRAQERIDELYHPLTTLKSLAEGEKLIINLKGAWNYWSGDSQYHLGFMTPTMIDSTTIDFASYPFVTNTHSATEKWQANNAIELPQGMVSPYRRFVVNRSKVSVEKVRVYGSVESSFTFQVWVNGETATSHPDGGGSQIIDYTWEGFDVDEASPFIAIDPNGVSRVSPSAIDLNVEIHINEIGDIGTNQWWNNIRNYPQMSVISYLSELLAHIGGCIVGSVNVSNKLRIVTFDEVAVASPQGCDIQGVKSIKMALDKLAQKNNYTHKENEDAGLPYLADGVIYTADDTLSLERKAFDSKFKVPRNTIVRLWEVEKGENGNSAKWVGGSDYICGWDADVSFIRNTGQDFERTIANYYTSYEAITTHPKVLEVTMRMNILELIAFDFERPLHIKQLGRKYLVKSIESESGDNYKLTLIQI